MITILLMFFEHVLITLPSSNSISTDFTIFYFSIPNSIPIYIFSELISPILFHCDYTQSNLYKMNTFGTSQKWSSWASGCPLKHLNKKKLYDLFLWMGFNCLKATATSRRQFTFYHSVPRNSWHSFYWPWKDERLSQPWSHPVLRYRNEQKFLV